MRISICKGRLNTLLTKLRVLSGPNENGGNSRIESTIRTDLEVYDVLRQKEYDYRHSYELHEFAGYSPWTVVVYSVLQTFYCKIDKQTLNFKALRPL